MRKALRLLVLSLLLLAGAVGADGTPGEVDAGAGPAPGDRGCSCRHPGQSVRGYRPWFLLPLLVLLGLALAGRKIGLGLGGKCCQARQKTKTDEGTT